jgi:hypothetical protein
MSTEAERKILESIDASGYPLEVDTANQLIDKGWSVLPQYVYIDVTTKKIRTIDILAYFVTKELNYTRFPRLVVECKTTRPDNPKPWAFHSTYNPIETLQKMPSGKGIDLLTLSAIPTTIVSLLQRHIDYNNIESSGIPQEAVNLIDQSHFFDKNIPRAYSCHVAFSNQEEDEPNIFRKAVCQIGSVCFDLAKSFPRWPILATIVYNGGLYEYRRGLKPELKPCNHVLYMTLELISEDLELPEHSIPPLMIDVVADTYFPQYLQILKKDFEILTRIDEELGRDKP